MHPLLSAAAAAAKAVPAAAASILPRGALPSSIPGAPGAPVAVPAAGPEPKTWFALHWPFLTHAFAGLFILAAILLIFLLAIQTTKQEGLTGSIGGRVESSYRGRLGAEEQLKRWTGIVAVSFVVFGFILSLTGI
jgi:protein translocase SecG subunit